MMTANRSSFKLLMTALTFAMPMALAIRTWGQEAPAVSAGDKQITGLPDDWSHHHVIFSNPGTEEESIHNGTHDRWLTIVNNPRYIMQQRMRGLPVQVPSGTDGADSSRTPNDLLLGRGEEPPKSVIPSEESGEVSPFSSQKASSEKKSKISIKKDWSMNSGAQAPASLTVTVNSNTASGGTSTITIDTPTAETLTASAPTAASATGSFTAAASGGAKLTITNGSNTLSLTEGASGGTCSGSGPSWSTTFAPGSGSTSWSTGIITVLASGSACSTDIGLTASGTSPTLKLTANTAGTGANTIALTWTGTSHFNEAWSGTTLGSGSLGTTAGSDGTVSATSFKYTTNSNPDTAAQLAADLVTAINKNTAVTGVMSVTTTGSSGILFQADNIATYSVSTNMTGISGTGSFSGFSTVQPNTYPAKYSFSTTTASCSDYVVYPTGFAGSTGGQASIVAYSNLYKTTCTSNGSVPSVSWAYNTGGTTGLSPVLSLDGTQVAFVQTSSAGVASLVILKPKAGQGSSATDSVAPDSIYTCTSTSGSCSTQASAYVTCKSGSTSCALVLEFDDVGSAAPNDTNSAPYYNYPLSTNNNQDTIYVGDNSGYLHQFTGVFTGTPAEVTTNWPVHASSESSPALTGPVYDEGTSKLIFVGDASGYLHSVTTSGTETVLTSSQLAENTLGLVDAPVVDSNTEKVYTFTGYSSVGGDTSYVNQYAATSSISGSYGTYENLGNNGTDSSSSVMYAGTFDNTYYTGSGTTGNLYACENGALFQIPLSSFGADNGTVHTFNTPVGTANSAAVCSPVTEFDGNASDDWLFVSVAADGSTTTNGITCTGACLYNYNVQSAGTTGSPVAAIAATGGTGGVVIDNNLTSTGESQVYFDTQANQACGGNGSTGGGSGICAVQASQSGLQ